MSIITERIEVDVPVRTAYNQWTQFEEFSRFMEGVERVRQVTDETLEWTADVFGQRRSWARASGSRSPMSASPGCPPRASGSTAPSSSSPSGTDRTRVDLTMRFEPTDTVERAADALKIVETRVKGDLARSKEFIESRGSETGAWRGELPPDTAIAG